MHILSGCHKISIASPVLAGIIALGSGWRWQGLSVALGLPFILFFPNCVLIAALFTGSYVLSGIERVALSFGLSIAVVPLIGLSLDYTPWGIRLAPVLISLLVFILAMSGIAWYRRLPAEEVCIPHLRVGVGISDSTAIEKGLHGLLKIPSCMHTKSLILSRKGS